MSIAPTPDPRGRRTTDRYLTTKPFFIETKSALFRGHRRACSAQRCGRAYRTPRLRAAEPEAPRGPAWASGCAPRSR